MPKNYTLRNGTHISVGDIALGEGGEGSVFEILGPPNYTGFVAKILYPDKRTPERSYKIRHMVSHPPSNAQDANGHKFLAWPEEMLNDGSGFAGFIMSKAQGIDLEELCRLTIKDELNLEWKKFSRNEPGSLTLRLILCSNLAKAINSIHAAGDYVIGDLKPENIRVQSNGLVSLLDLDSCQITEKGQVRFHSKMNTARYNPPENITVQKDPSWDLFILGVIFYEMLCGIHPFVGTIKAPNDNLNSPDLLIPMGFFPHGSKGDQFSVIPHPHQTFSTLPVSIRELFLKCFDDGHKDPAFRPTTNDWIHNLTARPSIKYFNSDRQGVIVGIDITLSWETDHAESVEISEGIGAVSLKGTMTHTPVTTTIYKIRATNRFGTDETSLLINSFPTPMLESLKVPVPDFSSTINLGRIKVSSPSIDVSVRFPWQNTEKPYNSMLRPEFTKPKPLSIIKHKISELSVLFDQIRKRTRP